MPWLKPDWAFVYSHLDTSRNKDADLPTCGADDARLTEPVWTFSWGILVLQLTSSNQSSNMRSSRPSSNLPLGMISRSHERAAVFALFVPQGCGELLFHDGAQIPGSVQDSRKVCLHTYAHTYTHTHIKIHTYTMPYIVSYIHTYMHTYICEDLSMLTFLCVHLLVKCG